MINNKLLDQEGYLLQSITWSKEIAIFIGKREGLNLTAEHWQIINISRTIVLINNDVLGIRKIVNNLKNINISTNSLYIQRLFPGNSLQLISKLSGLTKPAQCI